jgi:ribosomal protein S24E
MEKFEILKQKENPLFKRKEIIVSIEEDITPKNSDVEKFLSEKFSSPAENIKIKKILGKFGSHKFAITANIYASKEDKEKTEPKEKKEKVEEKIEKSAEQKPEEPEKKTEEKTE